MTKVNDRFRRLLNRDKSTTESRYASRNAPCELLRGGCEFELSAEEKSDSRRIIFTAHRAPTNLSVYWASERLESRDGKQLLLFPLIKVFTSERVCWPCSHRAFLSSRLLSKNVKHFSSEKAEARAIQKRRENRF
jgi:hypothetical protein